MTDDLHGVFRDYADAELMVQREHYQTRAGRFRAAVAETLTDWRLGRASQRIDFSGAGDVFRAGMAEIIELRLRAAYAPLFKSLQRVENTLAVFAAIRDDPYAPPPRGSRLRRQERIQPVARVSQR